jgi:hypothetical protein
MMLAEIAEARKATSVAVRNMVRLEMKEGMRYLSFEK